MRGYQQLTFIPICAASSRTSMPSIICTVRGGGGGAAVAALDGHGVVVRRWWSRVRVTTSFQDGITFGLRPHYTNHTEKSNETHHATHAPRTITLTNRNDGSDGRNGEVR